MGGISKSLGEGAGRLAKWVNKAGKGQNASWFGKMLRGPLTPIKKSLRKISELLTPGLSLKNTWRVVKDYGKAHLVNIRRNILKHPWRFTKTVVKKAVVGGLMAMAFKVVTGSLFGGNKSKLEDQPTPEPVPVGQDFRPGQAQAESDGGRKAVEGIAKNMAKNSKEQRKQDIDSKIAEVKSQQMADSSLKSHLTPINSSLPTNLEHIYARSEEVGEQNKSIIELLNRANDIALDNNKVGKKAFDLEKAQVESRLRKSSDLYQILQKMKSESESANAELNNIKSEIGGSEKRIAMRNAADIARAMRDKFKSRGGKSVGMLTLLSLGFIASVLNNTFDIIDDVRKKIVEGFEGVSEFLRGIGQSIGFIKDDTSAVATMQANTGQDAAKNVKNAGLDRNIDDDKDIDADPGSTPQVDNEGKKIVTQEDYRDGDGDIDKEKARKDNVNVKYEKKSGLEHAGNIASTVGLEGKRLWGAMRYATSKKYRLRKKIEFEEALEEIKNQAEKRASAAKRAVMDGADDVAKGAKKVTEKAAGAASKAGEAARKGVINKALKLLKDFANGPALKGLSKTIGKKNADIIIRMVKGIVGDIGKGIAVSRFTKSIPIVTQILHLTEAIDRGFEKGDWLGAFIEVASAITYFIPGAGPYVSAALDAFQVGRDVYRNITLGDLADNADKYLQEKAKKGEYTRNKKGDLLNEIIRKYNTGKESDSEIKDKAILGVKKVDEEVKAGKIKKDSAEYYKRINEELKSAGADIKYDNKGQLQNTRRYAEDITLSRSDKISTDLRKIRFNTLRAAFGPLGMIAPSVLKPIDNFLNGARKADWGDPKKVNKDKRINKTEKSVGKLETPVDLEHSPFGVPAKLTTNYKEGGFMFGIGGHKGIDVVIPEGADFTHPFYGEVVDVKKDEVSIRDTTGFESRYAHIKPKVRKGEKVRAGTTKIGTLLKSEEMPKGMAPHLHYETYDLQGNDVNPFRYIEGDESLRAKGSPKDMVTNKPGYSGPMSANADSVENAKPMIFPRTYKGDPKATVDKNYENYGLGLYPKDRLGEMQYGRIKQRKSYAGSVVDGLSIDQRALFIMQKLMKEGGLSPIAAAALTGVWWAESGLNPHITDRAMQGHPKHEIGQGIAQWTWERPKMFSRWHQQKYGTPAFPMDTDLNKQVEYALYEMRPRTQLMSVLRSTQNLTEAVDAVLRGYENGGTRFTSIEKINQLYRKGGGYEGLMRGRMRHTYDALEILRNSSGIQLPEGIADGSYWQSIGSGGNGYNFVFGNQVGMPGMMGQNSVGADLSKSFSDNFQDKIGNLIQQLDGLGGFNGPSDGGGGYDMGGMGMMSNNGAFGGGATNPEVSSMWPESLKSNVGGSSQTAAPLPQGSIPSKGAANPGWSPNLGLPTVNAPTIKAGDNNVTNNIYLSNNSSKIAEMM